MSEASVAIGAEMVAAIGPGLLAFIAVERDDKQAQADRLLERVLNYRMFSDSAGKMNLSIRDTMGGVLLVSQLTLAADTDAGNRPSFTPAALSDLGEELYGYFVSQARAKHAVVESGRFGADMKVSLVNDGPVLFGCGLRRPALNHVVRAR